ncbi:MAG: TolC family protein [Terriglobales bacterium]
MFGKVLLLTVLAVEASAQTATPAQGAQVTGAASGNAAITISLPDAIRLAQVNASQFRTAVTDAGIAHEDKVQARAALLPSLAYQTGAIFTQPNGTPSGVFIPNDGVNVYLSQGVAHEGLSVGLVSDFRRARALEAVAKAKKEIALRGLVTTVVKDYYGVIVARDKLQNAQAAADDAQRFLTLSRQLEQGGEVAHSDVIKAQLQANDRTLAVQDALLAEESAKLGLAVLIFPNFTENFDVVNDLDQVAPLPEFVEAQALAGKNNPEIAAVTEAMKASQHEVTAAFAGHLPSLTMDYWYGIEANHYALRTGNINNFGYSFAATLNVPIFNWGATQSQVKSAELQRDLARVQMSEAQRTALANLRIFYREAETARGQLDVLRQSVDLAAESLRLTTLRYQGGEATALEVVDAQNALLQARNNYDDGAARYRTAVAQLQTLTGSF